MSSVLKSLFVSHPEYFVGMFFKFQHVKLVDDDKVMWFWQVFIRKERTRYVDFVRNIEEGDGTLF